VPFEVFNDTLDRLPKWVGLVFYLWVLPGFADWAGLIDLPSEPPWLNLFILWPMLLMLVLAVVTVAMLAFEFLSWPFRAAYTAWKRRSKA